MIAHNNSMHEPDAELLSAEDAIQDVERVRRVLRQQRQGEQQVALQVPFHTLLEAIDQLDGQALREIVQRAEKRLASV